MTIPIPARLHRVIQAARSYSWLADPRRFSRCDSIPIDRPIFLLGTQGGGLTLLSRMLRRHPDVISCTGNHLYWTGADEMQNVFGRLLPQDFSGIRFKAPSHPKYPYPRSWSYACDELLSAYRRRAADAAPALRDGLLKAIRFAGRRHAPDPRRFRFLDKSQSYSVRLGLLAECLKECSPRFVLVARDPYASIYRAAIGRAREMDRLRGTLTFDQRLEVCAQHYANSMAAVFEDRDEMQVPVLVLRFEDLLADPHARLREVCEFVELEFYLDMLPSPKHRMPLGTRFLDRWHPVRPDVNDPYLEELSPAVVRTVNRTSGDWVERLGYALRREGS